MTKKRILLIDDHKEFRDMLKVFIERRVPNIEILESQSGEEGIETAIKEKPQIALIDIRLPRLDGIQTARQIKQDVPECHIITMSMFKNNAHKGFVTQDVAAFLDKNEFDSELPSLLHKFLNEQ